MMEGILSHISKKDTDLPQSTAAGGLVAYENTFLWECRGRLAIMPPIWYNG